MADKDVLADARTQFEQCASAFSHNFETAKDDIRFARLGGEHQWPAGILKERQSENRPCLTINKMTSLVRQVVNDARLNKPSIKVHPTDSGADKKTAEIFSGLIRNIEYTSSADIY